MISIIIPAYNEEKRIENTIKRYYNYFRDVMSFEILIIINNSTDRTEDIAKEYAQKYPGIKYMVLKEKGKGLAIKKGFRYAVKKKRSSLIGFVDADMSTEPEAFHDLIKNIEDYDGIIASRRMKESQIEKSWKRTLISWGFNTITNTLFFLGFHDTQCGAKLFKREAIEKVIDKVNTTGWIFDVDLLYRLKKSNYNIKEHPTTWEDKEGGSIKLFSTSFEMFCDLIKLRIQTWKS